MDAALQLSLTHRIRRRLRAGLRLASAAGERGAALLWSVVTIIIVAMLGVAAFYLSSQDRLIGENFESSYRALYAADEALSDFYATFTPGTSLKWSETVDTLTDGDEVDEYDGTDLIAREFAIGTTTLWVTPVKAVESQMGDIYALEAIASQTETRNRPTSNRAVRSFAKLDPPYAPLAVVVAPGGVDAKKSADKFKVDGYKKKSIKCGNGMGINGLMTPAGTASLLADHVEFPNATAIDTNSTANYTDMMTQLGVDWAKLTDPATYVGKSPVINMPAQYTNLKNVPWDSFNKKNGPWPIVRVTGDLMHTIDDSDKGFGILIVSGGLKMTKKLKWTGVILTGKDLTLTGSAELLVYGMMGVGLGCTSAQAAAKQCEISLQDKKIEVYYRQCNAEVAWSQLIKLRPLTPSRHTVLY